MELSLSFYQETLGLVICLRDDGTIWVSQVDDTMNTFVRVGDVLDKVNGESLRKFDENGFSHLADGLRSAPRPLHLGFLRSQRLSFTGALCLLDEII